MSEGRIIKNDAVRQWLYVAGILAVAALNVFGGWTPEQTKEIAQKVVEVMNAAFLLLAAANVPRR